MNGYYEYETSQDKTKMAQNIKVVSSFVIFGTLYSESPRQVWRLCMLTITTI